MKDNIPDRNRRHTQEFARPAFYKPPPRWHCFAALVGAIALEAGALAIASIHPRSQIPTELGIVQEPPPAEGVIIDLAPEPTPPPDQQPPPLPPAPIEPADFVLEDPTPPPRPQNATKSPPRIATRTTTGTRSGPVNSVAHANMLSAPRPSYSYEARRARQTGSGKFLLAFDANGYVTNVTLVQSTGTPLLDQLAISAFQRWRCRPGVYERVYVPITFTLTGAQL